MSIKDQITKIPFYFFTGYLIYGILFCLYYVCFTDTFNGDTLEHIHSSWLVYANFIPYKDFFQHHNPLLWYVFSPLIGLHEQGVDDAFMISFVISISIFISCLNYVYVYLITSRFFTDKLGGIIASAIIITPYVVLSIIHFRPDYFMLLSFFAGLYYYLSYLRDKKLWQLSLSFLLFWLSFMFLQKIIFSLAVLGCITLYLIKKNYIRLNDLMYSLMLPIILSLGFLSYLYHYNIIGLWYQSNFTFNLHIPELFENRRIGEFWIELRVMLFFAICTTVLYYKKSDISFKIIAILFLSELLQRAFFFSAFAYYYLEMVYLSAILSAIFIREFLMKKMYYIVYVLMISLCLSMYKPAIYNGNLGTKTPRFYQPFTKEISQHTTPCDYVINGHESIINLYNRDPYYYWNLLGQLDVIGDKIGIAPLMNISEIVETYKPKFIYIWPYENKYYAERGINVIVHEVDKKLVEKYYKPYRDNESIYILKPEYSKIKCDYDYKRKYYHAYD